MYTRRELLRTSAVGTALGVGVLASGSTATAAGAPFGDGVNLQPSYYCSGTQDLGWGLMQEYPDIQTVRIEIEPFSFQETGHTREEGKRWIDEAADNGYDVIATYHHYPDNGSADAAALQNAADFWVEHYDYLSRDSSFTINMMNEWGDHEVTADQYASAYNDAIDTVRSGTDYDGPIVCDAPGWGQEVHRLADAAPQLNDDDLILSAHVYPSAWNQEVNQALQGSHLEVIDETEYPCMIGEFGNWASSESGADWAAVVDYAKQLGWPVIGWAWNGDGSDQPMNMADPAWVDGGCSGPYSTSSYFDVVYDKLGGGGSPPEPEGPPAVGDNENAPTDPDGDGLYEDVNGNGGGDLADAVDLYQNRNSGAVQNNVDAYDFSGNEEIDLADVVQLYQENTS